MTSASPEKAVSFAQALRRKTDEVTRRSRQATLIHAIGLFGLLVGAGNAASHRDFPHSALMIFYSAFWHFSMTDARRYVRWVNAIATDVTKP